MLLMSRLHDFKHQLCSVRLERQRREGRLARLADTLLLALEGEHASPRAGWDGLPPEHIERYLALDDTYAAHHVTVEECAETERCILQLRAALQQTRGGVRELEHERKMLLGALRRQRARSASARAEQRKARATLAQQERALARARRARKVELMSLRQIRAAQELIFPRRKVMQDTRGLVARGQRQLRAGRAGKAGGMEHQAAAAAAAEEEEPPEVSRVRFLRWQSDVLGRFNPPMQRLTRRNVAQQALETHGHARQ
jgi:hypothetical protein